MITHFFLLIISLCILIKSADVFIDNSVIIAKRLHISKIVIGLTIVSIGTSLPELAISAAAAVKGHSEIALGNVVGSNICNIGIILGITALIAPIVCPRRNIESEGFLMLGITILFWVLSAIMGEVTRLVGGIYIISFIIFLVYLIKRKPLDGHDVISEAASDSIEEDDSNITVETELHDSDSSVSVLLFKIALALITLLISSKFMIESTVGLARGFNVSEHIIALSMIAFGTSLPELSVSITAIKKNHADILVGNIMGSNISNILLILGVTSLIRPIPIDAITLKLDYTMMVFLTSLMTLFLYQKNGINRAKGIVFLCLYGVVLWRCISIS